MSVVPIGGKKKLLTSIKIELFEDNSVNVEMTGNASRIVILGLLEEFKAKFNNSNSQIIKPK